MKYELIKNPHIPVCSKNNFYLTPIVMIKLSLLINGQSKQDIIANQIRMAK